MLETLDRLDKCDGFLVQKVNHEAPNHLICACFSVLYRLLVPSLIINVVKSNSIFGHKL